MNNSERWIVGVSGASGMRYSLRLLQVLSHTLPELHVIFSESALRVLAEEEGIKLSQSRLSTGLLFGEQHPHVIFHNPNDIGAEPASGSAPFAGMVICPCSMGTLAAVAHGMCQNLIHRAADVTIKERRKLVLVPRETPLSSIHLQNMLTLVQSGASLVPAMPGFYHQPKTLEDLISMMVMKILDQMGINNNLAPRWLERGNNGELSPLFEQQQATSLMPFNLIKG